MPLDAARRMRVRTLGCSILAVIVGFWVSPVRAVTVPVPTAAVATCNADERGDSPVIPPGGFFQSFVPDPTVTENGTGGQFPAGSSLTITAPQGFEFDTGAVIGASLSPGYDLNLSAPVVTSTQVRFVVLAKSTQPGTTTFTGLAVRPTTLNAAIRGTHLVRISATVFANPWTATLAVINVTPGVPYSLAIRANPLELPLNTTCDFTIVVRDEVGNNVDTQLIDVLYVNSSGSANPALLVYSGAGVNMNVPPNGQAIILNQTTTDQGEIYFQVRNNNTAEETVQFSVAHGSGTILPSLTPVAVRWYVESFPGGGVTRVLLEGEGNLTTDNRADGPTPQFALLSPDPVIQEGATGQIVDPIVITPPAGWSFDTGATVSALVVGSTQLGAVDLTAGAITIPVNSPSAFPGSLSRITFSGIAVRPNSCAGATLGEHYVRITTGTGASPGLFNAVLGRVQMGPGVAATLQVSANLPLNGVGLFSTLTITALDGCGNRSAEYTPTVPLTVTPSGGADPNTLTYNDYYGGGLTVAAGVATIAANTPFDAVGQYSLQVANSAEETVTFTVAHGALAPVAADIRWVTPTCTFTDGVQVWVSADKLTVLVLGTDEADNINLTGVEVAEGEWVEGDDTATPPVPGVPAQDSVYLLINGEHCPDTSTADPGVPLVRGLVVTVNSLAGDDLIDWTGAFVEGSDDAPPVVIGVVVNAGDGDDLLRVGPGISPDPGLSGGLGYDILDYSLVAGAVGDTGGPDDDLGVFFNSQTLATGFNGALRNRIDTAIVSAFEEIRGTEKNDTIRAADGVPTRIRGGEGDDALIGGNANDQLEGEAGDDFLIGGDGNDLLLGGEGDDSASGGDGNDQIEGGEGDDGPMHGGNGNDIILGGEGDDLAIGGDGDDLIRGGEGDDVLYGDDPDVVDEPIPTGADRIFGEEGDDYLDGGPGPDFLDGGAGDDVLFGGDGDDIMYGGEGDDSLYGEDGDDIMYGGEGDDYLDGGDGSDSIDGGDGDDIIIGGAGNDHLFGGGGDDGTLEIPFSGGPGDDIVEGGPGDDVITGGSGKNVIIGNAGDDTLLSDGEYDVCDYLRDGGPGGIDMDLEAGTCRDTWGGTDTVSLSFAIYRGSSRPDRMKAHPDVPVIFLGGANSDTLIGSRQGGDILYGEGGDDTLFGDIPGDETDPTFPDRGGSDILFGGAGDDTIWGGPGADEIYGDGDFVPQNFDEDRTSPNYYPDDQMIQMWSPGGGGYFRAIIEPEPIQAGGAIPIVYTTDSILNIAQCLRDYTELTTVKNAFALPASEFPAAGLPTLARPGVPPGGDTIYGGGAADLIAGGGGGDTIYGGTAKLDIDQFGEDWNVDGADLIYGDYVCNRPAALKMAGSWLDRYTLANPNPVTLTIAPPLANGMPAPWEPTPTDELLPDGSRLYPIPRPDTLLPYDLERSGGADEIHGGFGADVIIGGGSGDSINGNRQSDVIYGDFFFHLDRDDTYGYVTGFGAGVSGGDAIRGNEGTDYLFGCAGNDLLLGGDPSDPEGYSDLELPWVIMDEFGDVMQGNTGNDVLVGNDVYGLGGRDRDADAIDRGTVSTGVGFGCQNGSICFGVDSGPQDTADYSMVPPTSAGINVDLGETDPGGWDFANPSDDGEGGTDYIFGVENVVGSRSVDVIKGSTRSDEAVPYPYSGRYRNVFVTDAYGRMRFPTQLTHSNPPYTRNPLRWEFGYDNILLGEDGNDTIIGRRGADALCGGRGNDKIWGDGQFENDAPPGAIDPDNPATNGNDEIWGDEGDDEIYGEWGDDIVHGGPGNDFLSGGNGVDILAYTELDDYMTGGVVVNLRQEAVDVAVWGNIAQTYAAYGWPLNPITQILPPTRWPAVTLTMPDDVNYGQVIQVQFPGGTVLPAWPYSPGDMANNRGLGVAAAGGSYDVIVNRFIEPGTPATGGAIFNPDRFETVYGSPMSDVLYGHSSAPTTIYGDSAGGLFAGGSADILIGGSRNDSLYGEAGNDVLEGRNGDDLLVGGDAVPTPPGVQFETPTDWVSYNAAAGSVVVNLAETERQDTVSDGKDLLMEIQNVLGSGYTDRITGNWRVNVLLGSGGDDTLIGRSDHDIVQGNRTYILSDTLHGGAGYDIANYTYGNPTQVRAAAANVNLNAACPAPDAANKCGFMSSDGEGGSDKLVAIEAIRESDDALVLGEPARKVISPGQSVRLDFFVSGGDGRYTAEFDPTTDSVPRYGLDGVTQIGTKKVAILAAPADQNSPTTPFVLGEQIPDYQAVRTLTGQPVASGVWRFTVYARPLKTTSFRVTATDQTTASGKPETAGRKQASRVVEVVVAGEMKVTIEQPEYIITLGQSVQLRGSIAGGVPPYTISWVAEDGSQATTLSATNILIPIADPVATTRYTLTVEDSAPDSLHQLVTAKTKVTVLDTGSGGGVPSGNTTPGGTGGSTNSGTTGGTNQAGGNSDSSQTTPNEVSGVEEADDTTPTALAPMCGFGVTSWVMLGNLLALAVMKRRRW